MSTETTKKETSTETATKEQPAQAPGTQVDVNVGQGAEKADKKD